MTKLENFAQRLQARVHRLTHRANGSIFPASFASATPLDLRIAGRVVLHAALVGVAAGLVGAAFFAGLEYTQRLLLEELEHRTTKFRRL